eukprot:COSAG04_NODE_3785_length_2534_cov_1.593429_2_plen_117_part_00
MGLDRFTKRSDPATSAPEPEDVAAVGADAKAATEWGLPTHLLPLGGALVVFVGVLYMAVGGPQPWAARGPQAGVCPRLQQQPNALGLVLAGPALAPAPAPASMAAQPRTPTDVLRE